MMMAFRPIRFPRGAPRLLLALLLALLLLASPTRLVAGAAGLPRPPAVADKSAEEPPTSQGAYRLGKVRILGVPVITVASPVVSGGEGPDAATRARVIEGNLEILYRSRNLCSGGEALAEWLVHALLDHGASGACGVTNTSSLGAPEALEVDVVATDSGLHRLEARVPGRPQPLALLTVTTEDAHLNGLANAELAQRWQRLLEQRLRVARGLMRPDALLLRLTRVLQLELALVGLGALGIALWRLSRRGVRSLEDRFGPTPARRRQVVAIHALHGLSRALLVAVTTLLVLMVGVATFAVPGQVPTALDLLLQPLGIGFKLLLIWALAFASRTLLELWLRQWVTSINTPAEHRQRRRQRYRSLQRLLRRMVDLGCVLLAGAWIMSDIPGFQELSSRGLLAGGALLGALALVFQGLLRDFVTGLVILFDDRYAIGDTVEIHGLTGEVIDLGVLSTELRCVDQRVALFQNGRCGEVVNHTKLRSGAEVLLTLSHRCRQLRQALAEINTGLRAFAADPSWGPRLLAAPQLRGLTAATPAGIAVSVLLVTVAGEQGPAARELRLRLVERLQRRGIPLAEADAESADGSGANGQAHT